MATNDPEPSKDKSNPPQVALNEHDEDPALLDGEPALNHGKTEDFSAGKTTQNSPKRDQIIESWVGHELGRYEVTGLLGVGGMGVVYRAHDADIDREVAIKILPRIFAEDSNRLERFQSEARAAGQLMHPHIVPIYEVGREGETHYIVMELMSGGTTEDYIKQHGPFSPDDATRIVLEVCVGLKAAHEIGLVHRDIKPDNLLRTADNSTKLADFGLAKGTFRNSLQLTQDGHLVGTPYYMSPEQCQGNTVDCRSDIYSLGATYYKLLTGENPYQDKRSTVDILHSHCHAPVLNPCDVNPRIPQICADIVANATAKSPSDRYQTPSEMQTELEAALKIMVELPAVPPNQSVAGSRGPVNGSFRLTRPILIGVCVLLGFLGWYWFQSRTNEDKSSSNSLARGVTEDEIIFGTTTAFSGANHELGQNMVLGVRTCFAEVNAQGGIHGRRLKLVVLDDGYEPKQALENMKELIEQRKVFAVIGNVGTPTGRATVPYALENQILFFAPLTGAEFLRKSPPDRYVFNFRASYSEETEAIVRYFVDHRQVDPKRIAVFAQNDSYGEDGFQGVAKALFQYGIRPEQILRVSHDRNSVQVRQAVETVEKQKEQIDVVILVSTYSASAQFVYQLRQRGVDPMQFAAVSFVGSESFCEEMRLIGPEFGNGVIITEVVPPYRSNATGVLRYRRLLKKHFPERKPGFVSLEGFIAAECLVAGLKAAPPEQLNTETLIDSLEKIRDLDLGIGPIIQFGPSRHQASHKVWGTVLDERSNYGEINLDAP